ncbi:shieldin complex subunit 1-like [Narcine bancroftii]|uniref:shieldin complex subunit 1-like n=1 Tax=Narcine bancroftii TaxID=1343680 RepID=UPI003831BA1A
MREQLAKTQWKDTLAEKTVEQKWQSHQYPLIESTSMLPAGRLLQVLIVMDGKFENNHFTGSGHPSSEDGIAPDEPAELHLSSEEKEPNTGITQTMEDYFKGAQQRKPLDSNSLSDKIIHLLTSKISQLQQEKAGQYLLRSFQMALVLFHTHGSDIFKQRNPNKMHFCPSACFVGDSAEFHPVPGLSQDVFNFIQQEI